VTAVHSVKPRMSSVMLLNSVNRKYMSPKKTYGQLSPSESGWGVFCEHWAARRLAAQNDHSTLV
jgi:hypothetical protein